MRNPRLRRSAYPCYTFFKFRNTMNQVLRFAACAVAVATLLPAQERVDLDAIYRIKNESFEKSKVMEHMFYLTDVYGPRLTGSDNYKKAADWAVETLKGWGLKDAHLEKWGPFGRSWQNQKFVAALTTPSYQPLIGFPLAWTASTEGVVSGEPVLAVIEKEADFDQFKGKLKGKIVLTQVEKNVEPIDKPQMLRYTDQELADLANAPDPARSAMGAGPVRANAGGPRQSYRELQAFRKKVAEFYRNEGVALLVQYGYQGDGGTVFGSSGGSRDPKDPIAPATIAITPEHYNRIARLLQHKQPVGLEVEVKNDIKETNDDSFNVVANLPGTGKHKDEIVMIGAHLDSWQGGTGATDNGAGSAVMLEVIRVLSTLKLPLDRTVRIGLWSGEEEGLLGSRAYVKEVFADRATMKTTSQWDKFDAYYNVDNGTGKIRGIYLQGNEMARPIFENWLAPFKDLGVSTISIRNTGGTDHLAFDAIGLPGFQFIQDPDEYFARTHHSNMDVYDRIQKGDMMQMSAVVASLVYQTANRPEKMPRKPKPEAQPERTPGSGPSGN